VEVGRFLEEEPINTMCGPVRSVRLRGERAWPAEVGTEGKIAEGGGRATGLARAPREPAVRTWKEMIR